MSKETKFIYYNEDTFLYPNEIKYFGWILPNCSGEEDFMLRHIEFHQAIPDNLRRCLVKNAIFWFNSFLSALEIQSKYFHERMMSMKQLDQKLVDYAFIRYAELVHTFRTKLDEIEHFQDVIIIFQQFLYSYRGSVLEDRDCTRGLEDEFRANLQRSIFLWFECLEAVADAMQFGTLGEWLPEVTMEKMCFHMRMNVGVERKVDVEKLRRWLNQSFCLIHYVFQGQDSSKKKRKGCEIHETLS